ncbi:MFS transporter [Paracraurococcus lichenis]|uniref:MFS transporter n=1 Tax=Paracraurococcus lichenis TaxID=3064888 RepID=A0ABT9E9X6_9PROT|nr:MFS transporter [Paracraurococcus sp. LOR1-02]MDO9712932.1 MFS transporter [Paracraurococcus sp. LOR1-02]
MGRVTLADLKPQYSSFVGVREGPHVRCCPYPYEAATDVRDSNIQERGQGRVSFRRKIRDARIPARHRGRTGRVGAPRGGAARTRSLDRGHGRRGEARRAGAAGMIGEGTVQPAPAGGVRRGPGARRTLAVAGTAHALHDGYTDLIYVLLPLWQAEFGLGYGMLAALRGLYAAAMAVLQLPSGWLAERVDGRIVLAIGTALAAGGYALAGFTGSLAGLCGALAISGAGSSTQHPIASAAVARAYGASARGPLGTYNFTGDLGKAAIPGITSLLLTLMPWRGALWLLAAVGAVLAAMILLLMPPVGRVGGARSPRLPGGRGHGGFRLLLVIGVLDTGVRMGLLTFLPFLLQEKGASLPAVGIGLALVFLGGAAGKFACGWLGDRIGVLPTVLVTEGGTAACILGVLALPIVPLFALLPVLGIMLNGTSSVLYGTVPDLTPPDRAERAFALFYTGTIGSGAVSPVFYGLLGDWVGAHWATAATAMVALATLPLAFALAPCLAHIETQECGRPAIGRREPNKAGT